MSGINDTTSIQYREIPGFPSYRVGSDGSVWTCYFPGSKGLISATWRRRKVHLAKTRCTITLHRDGKSYPRAISRLVLESFVGPCPFGMEACHDPDPDPANNRLDNLRWDTHRSNVADTVRSGRHPKGSLHRNSKLTEGDIAEIRRLRSEGWLQKHLARQFGVSQPTISCILSGKMWAHVTPDWSPVIAVDPICSEVETPSCDSESSSVESIPDPDVEYREIPRFPNYRFGADGSFWSRYILGHHGQVSDTWRRRAIKPNRDGYCYVSLYFGEEIHATPLARLILEAFMGPCPDGMQACHDPDPDRTNNRIENLRWDTRKANMADKIRHGRQPRGSLHPIAKLNEFDVAEIRRLASSGWTQNRIAARFGMSQSTISSLINGKHWKHVPL